jgi:cytochrome c biogenesis protein CcmG/thiol:disulfide interchange protein DsbE
LILSLSVSLAMLLALSACGGEQADSNQSAASGADVEVAGEAPADGIARLSSAAEAGGAGEAGEGHQAPDEGKTGGRVAFAGVTDAELERIFKEAPQVTQLELPPEVDRLASPELDLVDLSGRRIDLAELRGQVVLLAFWATWCRPCIMEIPHLIHLTEAYEAAGFKVLGISVDRNGMAAVKPFMEKKPQINYTIVPNGVGAAMAFGGIRNIPTSFLVDRKGRVVRAFVGLQPPELLEGYVQAALKEPA